MIVGDAWVEWSAPGADDHQLIPSARFESIICFSLISAHLAKISKLVTIVGDARFNGIIRSSPQALVHYQLIPSLQSRRRPETSLQQLSDYSLGTRKDAQLSGLDLNRSRWDEAIGDTFRPRICRSYRGMTVRGKTPYVPVLPSASELPCVCRCALQQLTPVRLSWRAAISISSDFALASASLPQPRQISRKHLRCPAVSCWYYWRQHLNITAGWYN